MRLYNLWRSKEFAKLMPSGKTIELFTPPFLLRAAKYWLSEWEYLPGGWDNGNIGRHSGLERFEHRRRAERTLAASVAESRGSRAVRPFAFPLADHARKLYAITTP